VNLLVKILIQKIQLNPFSFRQLGKIKIQFIVKMAEGRFIDLKSQDIKHIDEILLRYVSPNNRDSARRDLVTRFELFKYQVVEDMIARLFPGEENIIRRCEAWCEAIVFQPIPLDLSQKDNGSENGNPSEGKTNP